jgi:hypothetical protein
MSVATEKRETCEPCQVVEIDDGGDVAAEQRARAPGSFRTTARTMSEPDLPSGLMLKQTR